MARVSGSNSCFLSGMSPVQTSAPMSAIMTEGFRSSRNMLGWYIELGHDRFLPYPLQSISNSFINATVSAVK
jgi:hypothetical protein